MTAMTKKGTLLLGGLCGAGGVISMTALAAVVVLCHRWRKGTGGCRRRRVWALQVIIGAFIKCVESSCAQLAEEAFF
jgi:hypothetical protein